MKGAFHATLALLPTPHDALVDAPACADPPNSKSIANQSLHQRSGFSAEEWRFLNSQLSEIADLQYLSKDDLSKSMIVQDPKAVFNRLHELLMRGKLYIHCLTEEGFLTKPRQEQWDIINAFHQEENINPSILANNEIDTPLLMSQSDNEGGFSQAEIRHWWETFVTRVEEVIKNLTPSP
jgi:hypothetical protein